MVPRRNVCRPPLKVPRTMEKTDRKIPTALELLDMWREKMPGRPSRRKALERLGMPEKDIQEILNSKERHADTDTVQE